MLASAPFMSRFCSRLGLNLFAVCLLSAAPCVRAEVPQDLFEIPGPVQPAGAIDAAVFDRLRSLKIEPAYLCSDVVFVRRVFLDAIGTLPTAAEATAFLEDRSPDKRAALIERLLAREEFADTWAMKWSDLLRVKAEFPINLWPNAAQAYHRWIRDALHDNLPYDQFARALLTSSGSNFRVGPVNFYRAVQSREPTALARAVALTFMGARAEQWPATQLEGFGRCFSTVGYKSTQEWKEEIVFFDPSRLPADARAVLPDGTVLVLSAERDPRELVADWLTAPGNPWFARAMANRVWFWLLGRGIVHEPDDLRADNPPTNPPLLSVLEREFVAARFDVKQLFRLILNSRTYQLSSIARSTDSAAEANFAFYAPRRLEAEILIDAINQITGGTESYSSAIPEPFTFVPAGARSIALPDGSITSSFLETFGRPARDTGRETERTIRLTSSQRLHLLNSTHIQHKLAQGPTLRALARAHPRPRELVDALYLTILSRPPTNAERSRILAYSETAERRAVATDLAWALINSTEFLYRH